MYSSEDLERFYFQYQSEGLPKLMSIQDFCIQNKVPYNLFSKWYKDTRKKIVEVQVDGFPSESTPVPSAPITKVVEATGSVTPPTRLWVELRMSNGMHVSQKNLTYQELTRLIEKLEGLC